MGFWRILGFIQNTKRHIIMMQMHDFYVLFTRNRAMTLDKQKQDERHALLMLLVELAAVFGFHSAGFPR